MQIVTEILETGKDTTNTTKPCHVVMQDKYTILVLSTSQEFH
jgi:hypothetical protein